MQPVNLRNKTTTTVKPDSAFLKQKWYRSKGGTVMQEVMIVARLHELHRCRIQRADLAQACGEAQRIPQCDGAMRHAR